LSLPKKYFSQCWLIYDLIKTHSKKNIRKTFCKLKEQTFDSIVQQRVRLYFLSFNNDTIISGYIFWYENKKIEKRVRAKF